jgi:hypothetical protein
MSENIRLLSKLMKEKQCIICNFDGTPENGITGKYYIDDDGITVYTLWFCAKHSPEADEELSRILSELRAGDKGKPTGQGNRPSP